MTKLCAWCKNLMAGPPPEPGERVSHGCCLPCEKKLREDAGRLRGEVGDAAYEEEARALLADIARQERVERLCRGLRWLAIATAAAGAVVATCALTRDEGVPFSEIDR